MYIDRPHSPAGDFDFGVALWSLAVPLDEVSEWTTSTPVNLTSARLGWLRTDAECLDLSLDAEIELSSPSDHPWE